MIRLPVPVELMLIHGLLCKRSFGRNVRHHAINDLIWRTLNKANILSQKQPAGLLKSNGKRPIGLMLTLGKVATL